MAKSTKIDEEELRKFVFNSELVEELTQKINDGIVLKRYQNPWFKNEIGNRRAGITFAMTPEEIAEYIKCKTDIKYFAQKYCKIKVEDGSIKNLTLRDYQIDILELYQNRKSILCGSRQIGKTINAAITMLHFVTFNNDKNIMIVANIASTTIEIVDKIKSIYVHLPFFLKVGIKNWNQRTMIFENGCRIKTAARSRTPAIGFTIDFLYLDEFAHIPSNIIEPYYQAVYPVVSAVENSKIIITSTPNGMNLFYRLLTDAERPEGDPQKNQFKALRIYWYQVPGRFVTFYRLNPVKLFKFGLTEESLYEQVIANFSHLTKVEKKFDAEIEKETIAIHNNELCPEELTKSFQFYDNNNVLTPIQLACDVSTWKEDSIKNIGGEDAFNQEYGLRFINATRSILSESVIDTLIKGKKHFEYRDIPMFDDKLRFSYRDLAWVDNDTFNHANRKDIKGIMSIDISEGLGQDYTIINIFRIALKPIELIEAQKSNLYDFSDFFWLEQIGLYRSNLISVKQLSDLFYMLAFEYFDYEKFRVVLETNTYGSEFLAHLPHVFDGNNNYGSGIFFRYKHRMDSSEEKVGLKLGDNKNLLVKDYQENMNKRNFHITNEDNIKEITTFVRHITSAGNVRYAADIGKDDLAMSLVNASSIFSRYDYKEMIQDFSKELPSDVLNYINNIINNSSEAKEVSDYSALINVNRRRKNATSYTYEKSIDWHGKKYY
jgi:hypothetical protein